LLQHQRNSGAETGCQIFHQEGELEEPELSKKPSFGCGSAHSVVFIECQRRADSRCGQSLLNPVTLRTSKRTAKTNSNIETDKVRIGKYKMFYGKFPPCGKGKGQYGIYVVYVLKHVMFCCEVSTLVVCDVY
jgi:hypothetical protein